MNPFPHWMKAALALSLLGLLAAGAWFYRAQERHLSQKVENELTAIAKLKVGQIATWRKELLDEGAKLMGRPLLAQRLVRYLANPEVGDRENLLAEFRVLQQYDDYTEILLVDPEEHVHLNLSGETGTCQTLSRAMAVALGSRKPVLTDLHRETTDATPHISMVLPLFAGNAETGRPAGALVLVSNAERFLYPIIQSWPTLNQSAETLLVRRDGDEVLFLNDLRHQPETALRLRIPLSRSDVPAVMAVLGKQGVVQGKDYRGVEVLSVILPIPDSAWFMVSKMDAVEALSEVRRESLLILGFLLGLVALTGAGGLLVWQQNQKAHYRALYRSEAARRSGEERYGITLKSIGDAVIATDAQGRADLLNPIAEVLTGWKHEEARGKPLAEVFHIINEETRAELEDPVARVLKEGKVVGLANHTLLIARDGTERPIADAAAPIRDEQGAVSGVVLVFRDRTEDRALQRALRESERLNRSLVEHLPQRIFIKDRNSVYVSCNAHFAEDLGMTPEQVVGKDDFAFFPAELAENYRADDQAVMAANTLKDIEERYLVAGEERTAHTVKVPYHDESDRVIGVLGIYEDITARKQAEQALKASEDHFRQIFEQAAVGMSILSASGAWLQVNQRLCHILGYSHDELMQLDYRRITPPEHSEHDVERVRRMVAGARDSDSWEKRYIRKDGEVIWVRITTSLFRSEDGEPKYFITVTEDITERKQAERALQESEEWLSVALNAANLGKWKWDLIGGLIQLDDRCRQMYGLEGIQVGLEDMIARVHPDDAARVQQEMATALDPAVAADRYTTEYRVLLPNGDYRWLAVEGMLSFEGAGGSRRPLMGVGTARDISARKRDEEEREKLQAQLLQAQKMESVGRLAGGVAHDFNNMLSVIIGHTEMALDNVDPKSSLHFNLEEIGKAAQRSADLTRQLLAFARRQTVMPQILDLNDTVAGMLKMLRRLIGEDIDLAWMPGANLWPVKIDPAQIDQILANLTVNARDAIAGVGKVTIETENVVLDQAYCADHAECVPGNYVMLAVSDDGSGMQEEVLDRLFEPFFTTKEVGRGTGLGLATVYGIVKQNDGFINVYSEPGKGTTFKICLARFEGRALESEAVEVTETPKGRGETLLLVEDEAAILDLGKSMLEGLGYTVLAAGTPGEALRQAEAHTRELQLLITDVVMPEMNGRDLAERIMAIKPGLKCLFMSGYTADVIAHRNVLDEGVCFIQKPFSIRSLGTKVREALEQE